MQCIAKPRKPRSRGQLKAQVAAHHCDCRPVRVLQRQLSDRDWEILTRFYLHEGMQGKICQEIYLTEIPFRLFQVTR